ncbi:Histone-lysine N-methyltransferase SETMAR [Eumeta japonica]|uniref:Histone-lysine N-methyltransferase SETMAR n=1 Tax=Eumeta variegata TaxID=151549 RepID=A0A4C1VTH0_EUMVA|nr:Histone-lysine N-methyltransferase SETMAR [Eumeta japonica]
MLCVWWDGKSTIHYELLPLSKTINTDVYCQKLTRLQQEVEKKRRKLMNRNGMVFHHVNARPPTSLATQQMLRELGCEVLIMHPPCSSDLASSEFHLIRSPQDYLSNGRLTSKEDCRNYLSQLFG